MRKAFLAILACAIVGSVSSTASAQKLKNGVMDLSGYTLTDAGVLKRGAVNEGFQGFAIHKDYMVSLRNGGYASLARLRPDGSWTEFVNFTLGSQSK